MISLCSALHLFKQITGKPMCKLWPQVATNRVDDKLGLSSFRIWEIIDRLAQKSIHDLI